MKLVVKQITKFFIIGVSAVMVDFIIYYATTEFFGINNDIGKSLGFIIGSFYTYYLNKRWTWRNQNKSNKKMIFRFAVIYALSFIGNVLVNKYCINILPDSLISLQITNTKQEAMKLISLQLDKLTAFFFATVFSAVFNFLGQKFWVFKEIPEKDLEEEVEIEIL